VLIGCDGVNSLVAKWLGFKKPAFTGRSAIRGCVDIKHNHGFGTKVMQYFGEGVRTGFIPCDDTTIYWFFTWTPSSSNQGEPLFQTQYLLQFFELKNSLQNHKVEKDNAFGARLLGTVF
jgi:2-polyprenyl-6-methoxyphenol hydroxylase-like FAD-dependent oxidoreductase